MSESDPSHTARYFKLGVFVLIGVGALVGAVIIFGAGSLFEKTIQAETVVNESVNGLNVGSPVKYRGVTIGKVTGIEFAPTRYKLSPDAPDTRVADRYIVVEMALQEKLINPFGTDKWRDVIDHMIERGLRARVTTAGISGQAYIEWDFLDPKAYPPPPVPWTPKALYIPSAPSAIGQALDAIEEIATDLQKANLPKVVGHIDKLVTDAGGTVNDLRDVVQANKGDLHRAMAELPDIADRLKDVSARADQILHDKRLDAIMNTLSDSSQSLKTTLADVRQLIQDARSLLAGETDDIRDIITDLRRLAANGAAVTEDARQNPSRLLFGRPPEHQKPD